MATEFKNFPMDRVGRGVSLTGAILTDERTGESYVFRFPDYVDDDFQPVLVHPLTPEDWEALIKQTDLVEASVLAKAKDGKLYKAIIRKSARHISQQVSWSVFRRDGYACRYCGNDKIPLTVDHLVLWEEGGPSTEENLVAACKRCNNARGNTQYEEWLRSPHYMRVAEKLTPEQREANAQLVPMLDRVERRYHKGSRR